METFYFVLAFVIVLGFYAYSNLRLRKDHILTADSESNKNLTPDEAKKKSYYVKHKIYKDSTGSVIDPKDMIHMFVSGNSMSPCNIESGDEIIVMKIDDRIPLSEQIKKDDVLLIHLDDIRIYKLRRFYRFDKDGLATYYYDKDGEKRMSSIPYKPESVLGIAKYKVNASISSDNKSQKNCPTISDDSRNPCPAPRQQSGQPRQSHYDAARTLPNPTRQQRTPHRKRPRRKK